MPRPKIAQVAGVPAVPPISIDDVISEAEKVYKFLTSDGSLEQLAEKPSVQLMP